MPIRIRNIFPIAFAVLLASLPGHSQNLERLIVPLDKADDKSPAENQDQSRYVFPATGYEARQKDSRSTKGKTLFDNLNCAQCHSIEGQGGELGPALDGIGGHRGRAWLTARLLDPAKQVKDFPGMFDGTTTIMPHAVTRLTEARLLADYLLTLEEPKYGFAVSTHKSDRVHTPPSTESKTAGDEWQPKTESVASKSGQDLFVNLQCAACHSLDGSNRWFGPDLAGIGARLDEKKLEQVLSGAVRSTVMKKQTQRLGDEQVYDLKMFLLTLPKGELKNVTDNKKRQDPR